MEPGRRRWLYRSIELLAAGLLTVALAEVALRGLSGLGLVRIPRPADGAHEFWDARHPVFGVWHRPSARQLHEKECFSVTYRTNSVGARDAERSRRADTFRVVVLGDSFVEGWGIESDERLTDRLERETGFEHLNFGMSHFGPYQQYLVYRDLASGFEHDAVIATVLPVNDFGNLDYALARGEAWYDYRYRPYLIPEGEGFRHFDYREGAATRFLRHHSYAYNALRTLRALAGAGERARARARVRSYFWDFSETQLALLERSLELLAEAARGKALVVVLLPSKRDLRWVDELGPSRLAERLRPFAERTGARVVDLLPAMHAHTRPWKRYFLSCDHHWGAYGNRIAAELLLEALGPRFYPERPHGADVGASRRLSARW